MVKVWCCILVPLTTALCMNMHGVEGYQSALTKTINGVHGSVKERSEDIIADVGALQDPTLVWPSV